MIMKIVTWNVNGIRAIKTTVKDMLDSLDAHLICLQETKITRDMLDEPIAIVDGYEAYFSFSRKKTGYSGTANYCKTSAPATKAEEGLTGRLHDQHNTCVGFYGNTEIFAETDLDSLDAEGRCTITQHNIKLNSGEASELAVINVYVPRAGDREDRHQYKLKFLSLLQARAEAILHSGIHVIIVGDLNTTHSALDNCDEQEDIEAVRKSSRLWLNQLIQPSERSPNLPLTDGMLAELSLPGVKGGLFSDVYRRLHPTKKDAFTNWCTLTGARQTNYGRRLDYILVDTKLSQLVSDCQIMSDFEGSDHCPVVVTLNCTPLPSQTLPRLSTRNMPEFRGQQQKLSLFFNKSEKPLISENKTTGSTITDYVNCKNKQLSLKRPGSDLLHKNESKKANVKKDPSKQISLTSFFTKTETPQNKPQAKTDLESAKKNENCSVHENPALIKGEKISEKCSSESLSSISCGKSENSLETKSWKALLCGLPAPPLCKGHNEPCVLRTVKKNGPNKNKQFYVCSKPDGAPGNILSRCDFFQWLDKKRK